MDFRLTVNLDHDEKYSEDADMSMLEIDINIVGIGIHIMIPDIKDVKKFRKMINSGNIQKVIDLFRGKEE